MAMLHSFSLFISPQKTVVTLRIAADVVEEKGEIIIQDFWKVAIRYTGRR